MILKLKMSNVHHVVGATHSILVLQLIQYFKHHMWWLNLRPKKNNCLVVLHNFLQYVQAGGFFILFF